MQGRFLVASADAGTRESVRRAFAEFAVQPEECDGAMEAFASLSRRYDGVVVDCEDVDLALQLLAGIRSDPDRAATSVIALLPADIPVQQALSAGANFALHKPVRQENMTKGLRVSFRLLRPKERQAKDKEKTVVS